MKRDLERRLASLEQHSQDSTIKAISDLMDELSAEAAGGEHSKTPHSIFDCLEDPTDAS